MDGEVAMVHLIHHHVGRCLQRRTHIFGPTLGIGGREVDDGSASAIDTHRLGKGARTFTMPRVKGVEQPLEVTLHSGPPAVFTHTLEADRANGLICQCRLIDAHVYTLCIRGSIETEGGLLWSILHLIEYLWVIGRLRTRCHHKQKECCQWNEFGDVHINILGKTDFIVYAIEGNGSIHDHCRYRSHTGL